MYESRLKQLRKNKNLTQQQLADILEISQRGYSHYETGSRDIPIELLIALAKYYNTSIDYILELTNEEKPYSR